MGESASHSERKRQRTGCAGPTAQSNRSRLAWTAVCTGRREDAADLYAKTERQEVSLLRLSAGSMGMLPAAEIEDLVLTQVQAALAAPEVVQSVWQRVQAATPNIEEPVV